MVGTICTGASPVCTQTHGVCRGTRPHARARFFFCVRVCAFLGTRTHPFALGLGDVRDHAALHVGTFAFAGRGGGALAAVPVGPLARLLLLAAGLVVVLDVAVVLGVARRLLVLDPHALRVLLLVLGGNTSTIQHSAQTKRPSGQLPFVVVAWSFSRPRGHCGAMRHANVNTLAPHFGGADNGGSGGWRGGRDGGDNADLHAFHACQRVVAAVRLAELCALSLGVHGAAVLQVPALAACRWDQNKTNRATSGARSGTYKKVQG